MGFVGSAFRRFHASVTALKSWEASRFGSYVGFDTMARIRPVDGSRAATAAWGFGPSPWMPSKAAVWALGSSVTDTEPPCGWLLLTMSTTRFTNSRGSLPERIG